MSDESSDESEELGANPLGGMLDDEDGDVSNSFEEADSSLMEHEDAEEEKDAEAVRRDALKLFNSTLYLMCRLKLYRSNGYFGHLARKMSCLKCS